MRQGLVHQLRILIKETNARYDCICYITGYITVYGFTSPRVISRVTSRDHFIDNYHKEFPWIFFFYREILCKIFPDFQTWIGFFSTFFEQNQKTRKLRKFIYLELQLSQFSAKSETKKFFTFSLFTFSLQRGQGGEVYLGRFRIRYSKPSFFFSFLFFSFLFFFLSFFLSFIILFSYLSFSFLFFFPIFSI